VVILTGALVLARLRPRSASGVRSLSLATLVAALIAAVSFTLVLFHLVRGFGYVLAGTLLFFAAAGLCLLTAVVASVSLARARRWGELPLVGALGVLPLAYIVVGQELFTVATAAGYAGYLPTLANSAPLTAAISLLPILVYGLFLYAAPRDLDRPITCTDPSV
jgi:hypothetical protein